MPQVLKHLETYISSLFANARNQNLEVEDIVGKVAKIYIDTENYEIEDVDSQELAEEIKTHVKKYLNTKYIEAKVKSLRIMSFPYQSFLFLDIETIDIGLGQIMDVTLEGLNDKPNSSMIAFFKMPFHFNDNVVASVTIPILKISQ